MSRIIVKNLPDNITKEKLKQIFSEKGVVTDVQLKFTKDGKFRKFAFVGFKNAEMAEAARESLNKSFITTSQIQIEICSELGDPNKPRPWSKYASENIKRITDDKNEVKEVPVKLRKFDNQKIRDPKVLELLKSHKNEKLFAEFLEVNVPDIPKELDLEMTTKSEKKKKETDGEDQDEEEAELKKDNILANKDISDSEYIKLKTGVNLNLKDESTKTEESPAKKWKFGELYTVKLSGLRLRIKKSEIKEFLKPAKPVTIRRALKIKGVAYCGFKTEKEMRIAILKNRSFLYGRRIFISAVKKKNLSSDINTEVKWKNENERLKGSEAVAESGRIFIRNLPYTATEEELKEKFEKYGPITEFILPIDSFTRKPKGFAIVTFLIPEHACNAFSELDGTVFQGRMLHLLPALPNKTEEEDETNFDDSFKKKKLKKEKANSASSLNWNTFFIGENALADAMAATYNTTKENVLDDKQSGAAVRLALGETQLVNKIKEFLEENGVRLEAFENMAECARSNTVILVKNLPFGTKTEEIREKFSPFGVLKRVVVPPTGVAALVEFVEPFEAKRAFRRVAYSRFKHLPMYLEWAPKKVFNEEGKLEEGKDEAAKTEQPKEEAVAPQVSAAENGEIPQKHIPAEGATIFVKNLNFSTGDEALRQHFSSCGTIVSANVALKKNPKEPGKKLSMGYGFVEFSDKESADKALKTLQFSSLDDHRIELKRSNRTLASEGLSGRKSSKSGEKPSTTILVRNVPFQATQKEVTDLFKVFGEIKSVRLPKKMVGTGSHRGFCFVEFNTIQDAKRAFAVLSQSTHLFGRRLVLEWAASDDDVATLRQKTAQQFKNGNSEKKKNVTIEEESGEE